MNKYIQTTHHYLRNTASSLTLKSIPTVAIKFPPRKAPSLKRTRMHVFPTAESPSSITCSTATGRERDNRLHKHADGIEPSSHGGPIKWGPGHINYTAVMWGISQEETRDRPVDGAAAQQAFIWCDKGVEEKCCHSTFGADGVMWHAANPGLTERLINMFVTNSTHAALSASIHFQKKIKN